MFELERQTFGGPPLPPSGAVFVDPGFLGEDACARIRAAMDRGMPAPAGILGQGGLVDRGVRYAWDVDVDPGTLAFVERALDARRDTLSRWFSRALTAREGAGFLRYGPGGRYRRHRDRGSDGSWPDGVRRHVSVVAFLNAARERPTSGEFCGGVLRLLDAAQPLGGVAEIVPAPGVLVAFRADVLHEVTPVTAGTRDVIVDWFY